MKGLIVYVFAKPFKKSVARKERSILETAFSTSDLHRPLSSIGSSREPTPIMTEGGESSINSRQSTLSTMNSQSSLYQQMVSK